MLTRILFFWGALLFVFAPTVAHADVVDDASFSETSWHALDDRQLTGMAWAPDGSNRLFITNKEGRVRIVKYGPPVMEVETPFATLTPIESASECGLIGLAFDPDFQANHYVYFFVTVSNREQQIIRYTAQGDVGTDKTVIVQDLPTDGANHDGGAVAIGPDGKLYWAIGDNGNGTGIDDDLSSLASKVGRANRDGTVPNDNPFFDGGGDNNNDYIWARGLRNPFTMTFQPETGALWVNVVGDSYEQVFVVGRSDHAGYDDYENDQPAGYIKPIIKYRTNGSDSHDLTASGAVRSGGVVTFTSDEPHGFRRGERITIAGVGNASFNGDVFVSGTPSATTFTAQQAGANATSGDGSATTQNLGGSITGGTFYTSTQFPEAYRGDYFFGDFNSDYVVRAALSAPSTVERLELWSTTIHGYIDIETGPDGALYYVEHGGEIHRVAYKASAQALVVSNTNVWMSEGGQQSIGVSLAIAPSANVTVNVTRASGDGGISLSAGSTLTFTPANWNVPRAVTISSAVDADMASDVATLEVSASGITSQSVTVNAVEADGNSLVVSVAALELDEGADGTFTVALASEPAADVTVNASRSSGDGDVTVTGGATLTFTPANFDVAQTVTIAAAEDADNGNDSAAIAVAASGLGTRSIAVTVNDNDPAAPIITSSAATTAILNVPYSYTVTASGRPAPTFSLSTAPAGMTIGGSSGAITWTPSSSGTFPVAVVAANGVTPNATQSFDVTVTADTPPTCSLTEPVVNQVLSGTTAEFFGDGTDDIGAVRAEFFVDGTVGYSDVGTSGHYHWRSGHALWDTTAYNDGSHQLKMKITDTVGQSCEVEIGVVIDNGMEPVADAGTSADGGITAPGQDGGPPRSPGTQPPTVAGSSGSSGSASSAGRGGNASSNPGAGSAAPRGDAAPEGDPDLTGGGCSLLAGSSSRAPLASLGLLALALAARRRRS